MNIKYGYELKGGDVIMWDFGLRYRVVDCYTEYDFENDGFYVSCGLIECSKEVRLPNRYRINLDTMLCVSAKS